MSHILHLGHQVIDIAGIAGLISTDSAGFDATLDVNGLKFSASASTAAPFTLAIPEPAGSLWLGVRYVTPNSNAESITRAEASFLEFRDETHTLVAQVKPLTATKFYHAIAHGDTSVQGTSIFGASNGQAQWIDVMVDVDTDIIIDFYSDGVLQSSATAANTGGKGKPRFVTFANLGLHSSASSRTWYLAHIAVLDGVSTIGRRFVRRTPHTVATYNEMAGSLDALKDGNIATRVASTDEGQRLSFSLTGPTGPVAVSAIAGVHLKQLVQAGSDGPDAAAGFLRMSGVNHDASPVTVPALAPVPVYSSWPENPATSSPWTDLTLPTEVGILSA